MVLIPAITANISERKRGKERTKAKAKLSKGYRNAGKGKERKRKRELENYDHRFEKMNRKPGDWTCRSCQHLNFSRRDSCQRCGEPREFAGFGSGRGGSGSSFGFTGADVRPGDWYCQCGAHNFASRSSCFKCGGFKEETSVGGGSLDGEVPRSRGFGFGGGGGGGRSGWKSGDWICTRSGCNEHNFASRMECFRCNAPRDSVWFAYLNLDEDV
ncbi:hypothetical protein HPP92_008654 [Vanilla planifolia]|uniref:RanBP2-type domain-containing protein n=1 Tax=Vanilla planifolia TaxID=51239 RepID=A0A835RAV3_VANPL|nr:hypothetical protein HPP92_008654 [Vanilla planifolia]